MITGLLICESSEKLSLLLFVLTCINFASVGNFLLTFHKARPWIVLDALSLYLFSIAVSPTACLLCLAIFQIRCHYCIHNVPNWLSTLLVLLSNDIHLNPGPQVQSNCLNFMNWNTNSLVKDNFQRVRLIEAHNCIFNYDLISICETHLNDSVELPETLLNNYTFELANHPANNSRGGVGLFFKNSLPVVIRRDLSFNESIVAELKFGRKKVFFTVLYRSPCFKHTSPEFHDFLLNFKNMYSKIKAEKPFATFFTGDFNAHSQFWWPGGDTTPEGK